MSGVESEFVRIVVTAGICYASGRIDGRREAIRDICRARQAVRQGLLGGNKEHVLPVEWGGREHPAVNGRGTDKE